MSVLNCTTISLNDDRQTEVCGTHYGFGSSNAGYYGYSGSTQDHYRFYNTEELQVGTDLSYLQDFQWDFDNELPSTYNNVSDYETGLFIIVEITNNGRWNDNRTELIETTGCTVFVSMNSTAHDIEDPYYFVGPGQKFQTCDWCSECNSTLRQDAGFGTPFSFDCTNLENGRAANCSFPYVVDDSGIVSSSSSSTSVPGTPEPSSPPPTILPTSVTSGIPSLADGGWIFHYVTVIGMFTTILLGK